MKSVKVSGWLIVFIFIAAVFSTNTLALESTTSADNRSTEGTPIVQQTDIKWFKQELKIDPKYTERREGILGMNWVHFITMVFLVIFFFGALIVYHRRTTRTTRILEQLLKEE